MIRRIVACAVVVFFGAGCASIGVVLDEALDEETTAGDGGRTPATVTRVVDGDTIEVSPQVDGIEDVRLIGIDTPEPYASGSPEPLSREASDFTRDNLEGEEVSLEFDEETTDDYGRLLAYVYTGSEMFNERIISEGYAQVATFPPNTRYLSRFEAAQEEAQGAGRGIWGLPEEEACLLRDRGNGLGGGC
ncbi:MAG: thermonuclease family protein [Rubrobacter sp.]